MSLKMTADNITELRKAAKMFIARVFAWWEIDFYKGLGLLDKGNTVLYNVNLFYLVTRLL
jgi:hypothetical protein